MAAAALDEETTAKVLRQIEYYFGDSSLPGDAFLLGKIAESEDELVDLALLCSFTKMRTHLGVKETDPARFPADKVAAVAEVLRKSTFLKLSEDGKRVGRVNKLEKPEVIQAELDARSIAANPFPYKMGMEKVEAIFKPHAEVKSVRLPRHKGVKIPTGFAIIEFPSKEVAGKVLKLELTCEGVALELESKTAFDARKETLLENDKGKDKSQKRERQPQKQDDVEEEIKKGVILSFTAKKIGASDETEKAAEAADTEGEGEGEKLSREDIKEGLAKFGTIKYVDYAKGKESGFLRFADPAEAQKLREAAAVESKGGMTIANHLVTFEALEGEAEEEYWKKVKEGQGQRKRDFSGGRGFGGGRGRGGGGRRGGRGGRGGRGRGPKRPSDGEGPKAKSQKTE
ncbi:hypothetical protein M758_8G184800 [Ceratodon purpureus]|nr:hypothetical protein M758_8G184800 [Ceratodon purpureus]